MERSVRPAQHVVLQICSFPENPSRILFTQTMVACTVAARPLPCPRNWILYRYPQVLYSIARFKRPSIGPTAPFAYGTETGPQVTSCVGNKLILPPNAAWFGSGHQWWQCRTSQEPSTSIIPKTNQEGQGLSRHLKLCKLNENFSFINLRISSCLWCSSQRVLRVGLDEKEPIVLEWWFHKRNLTGRALRELNMTEGSWTTKTWIDKQLYVRFREGYSPLIQITTTFSDNNNRRKNCTRSRAFQGSHVVDRPSIFLRSPRWRHLLKILRRRVHSAEHEDRKWVHYVSHTVIIQSSQRHWSVVRWLFVLTMTSKMINWVSKSESL